MLSVGIIGPNRNVQGIGEYVAKYFFHNDIRICGVVANSYMSAKIASEKLFMTYGIKTRPYLNTKDMISIESPDAIAICSPAINHEKDILICLENNINVFCEKPLIWRDRNQFETVNKIISLFNEKKLVLHQNTQWIYVLDYFEKIHGKIQLLKIEDVKIELACREIDPLFILKESVAHANSIILALSLEVNLQDITFNIDDENKKIRISFKIKNSNNKNVSVLYVFAKSENQPRALSISINGNRIERKITMKDYKIYFTDGTTHIRIEDPLNLSIKDFIYKMHNRHQLDLEKETKIILNNFKLIEAFKTEFEKK